MEGLAKAVDQLIYVGIGVFIFTILMVLVYIGTAQGTTQIALANPASIASTTSTASAINQNGVLTNAANTLTFTCTGSCAFLNGNSTTITVAGSSLTAATNTVFATAGPAETQTFTVTNNLAGQTLTSTTGNFFTINSVTLSLVGKTNAAVPSITLAVAQTTNSVAHNSAPAAYATNTVTGQTVYALTPAGATQNFTTFAAPLPNAYGGGLSLAIYALVFIAVIGAVIWAVRGFALGSSGGIFGM